MKTIRITGMAIAYEYIIEEGNTFSGQVMLAPRMIQVSDLPLSLAKEMSKQVIERVKKNLGLKDGEFNVKFCGKIIEIDSKGMIK